MPIHVRAEPGQYAEAVLLPGDPLRAKYIAETYLEDVVQRNSERGLLGYTGTYNGKPVRVRGTFTPLTAGSAKWEQAYSPDGGRTWETNYVMLYTR